MYSEERKVDDPSYVSKSFFKIIRVIILEISSLHTLKCFLSAIFCYIYILDYRDKC